MAQHYYPLEAGPGSIVSEDDWWQMAQWWMQPGVYLDYLNGLLVHATSSGREVKIKTGAATAYGLFFRNDAEYTLTGFAVNSSGNPRIDSVVVRFDWTSNTVTFFSVVGTPAGSPVPPTLALTPGGVWDLELARVAIANGYVTIADGDLTDRRVNAAPRPHDLLSTHTASGQGVGYPLRTTSSSAFSFGQIGDAALDGSAQRQNILLNGGFESKIRAASSATAVSSAPYPFLHDGWQAIKAGTDTLTVQDSTSVVQADSQHSALCSVNVGTGAGGTWYFQQLFVAPASVGTGGYPHLRGKAISLRGLVKQQGNYASTVRLFINSDGTGGTNQFSSYHGTNSNWETLDVANYVIPNDATYIIVGARFEGAAGAADIVLDDLMLVLGAVPTNYVGEPEWETTRKASARYQRLPISGSLTFSGYNAASWDYVTPIPFSVPMAKAPTVTIATAFSMTNANTPTVAALDRNLWQITIRQNTGSPAAWQGVSGVVVAEANPS